MFLLKVLCAFTLVYFPATLLVLGQVRGQRVDSHGTVPHLHYKNPSVKEGTTRWRPETHSRYILQVLPMTTLNAYMQLNTALVFTNNASNFYTFTHSFASQIGSFLSKITADALVTIVNIQQYPFPPYPPPLAPPLPSITSPPQLLSSGVPRPSSPSTTSIQMPPADPSNTGNTYPPNTSNTEFSPTASSSPSSPGKHHALALAHRRILLQDPSGNPNALITFTFQTSSEAVLYDMMESLATTPYTQIFSSSFIQTWTVSSQEIFIPPAPPPGSNKSLSPSDGIHNLAAIIGGCAAGGGVVLLAAAGAWFWRQRSQKSDKDNNVKRTSQDDTPSTIKAFSMVQGYHESRSKPADTLDLAGPLTHPQGNLDASSPPSVMLIIHGSDKALNLPNDMVHGESSPVNYTSQLDAYSFQHNISRETDPTAPPLIQPALSLSRMSNERGMAHEEAGMPCSPAQHTMSPTARNSLTKSLHTASNREISVLRQYYKNVDVNLFNCETSETAATFPPVLNSAGKGENSYRAERALLQEALVQLSSVAPLESAEHHLKAHFRSGWHTAGLLRISLVSRAATMSKSASVEADLASSSLSAAAAAAATVGSTRLMKAATTGSPLCEDPVPLPPLPSLPPPSHTVAVASGKVIPPSLPAGAFSGPQSNSFHAGHDFQSLKLDLSSAPDVSTHQSPGMLRGLVNNPVNNAPLNRIEGSASFTDGDAKTSNNFGKAQTIADVPPEAQTIAIVPPVVPPIVLPVVPPVVPPIVPPIVSASAFANFSFPSDENDDIMAQLNAAHPVPASPLRYMPQESDLSALNSGRGGQPIYIGVSDWHADMTQQHVFDTRTPQAGPISSFANGQSFPRAPNKSVSVSATTGDSMSGGLATTSIKMAARLAGMQKSDGVEMSLEWERDVFVHWDCLLGAGAAGAVYKGVYQGKDVAIKVSTAMDANDSDAGSMQHELQIMAKLDHPNIVCVYGGCLSPPNLFVVEELMAGDLSAVIHRRKAQPLSIDTVLKISLDIIAGLVYLHDLDIVHRDLKPGNVLMTAEGAAKISDFGLARSKYKTYLSTKKIDAGTVAYMAPECFNSKLGGVTTKSDVFSFGVILWEMLTRERPWNGLNEFQVPPCSSAHSFGLNGLNEFQVPPCSSAHSFGLNGLNEFQMIYQVMMLGDRLPIPAGHEACHPTLTSLIEACWSIPTQRPGASEIQTTLQQLLSCQ
ncbi:hypothetical protein CEUSTIGMA_g2403.t1 [Chlamydomonas eustigma]|uniref:Protein kinase domain-containing protein n=1 Tax=Chlamydomonas eustigma TaxID=1157962 RepID=A0A250WVV1_9CHLO|nr:hypothetical protein CEUSTIGMA_g2403.t1 [Chlamydomonas eustigma]|eukprot:GAX74957.1 hypothetical protein CEUSTIGMA_g2403.t1 [Chlamydomonas eustigma]